MKKKTSEWERIFSNHTSHRGLLSRVHKELNKNKTKNKKVIETNIPIKNGLSAGSWWSILLIPALRRQRQEDLCDFKASLVYRVSSRTARTTQRNTVSKNKTRY